MNCPIVVNHSNLSAHARRQTPPRTADPGAKPEIGPYVRVFGRPSGPTSLGSRGGGLGMA